MGVTSPTTVMTNPIDIRIRGHAFRLFAERCLFWPEEDTLFVADTHLGKDATFSRQGIPVPAGSTEGTLRTLTRLLEQTEATRLCVLGDLFHARSSLSTRVRDHVESFLQSFSDTEFLLVIGNHDQHVGRLPDRWSIRSVQEGFQIGRIAAGHHPAEVPEGCDVYLCGHLHPAIKVGSKREAVGAFPCFYHRDGCLVLPAIGQFTGNHLVQPKRADDVWIIAEGTVVEYSMPSKIR